MTVGRLRPQRRGRGTARSPTPASASARESWRRSRRPGPPAGRTPISASCCWQRRSRRRPSGRGALAAGLAADRSPALTVEDAVLAYRAIRLASPGWARAGASSTTWPTSPTVTLLEAMRAAAGRDRIARQYATGFADVFDLGVPRLRRLPGRRLERALGDEPQPILAFLAAFPDTPCRPQARPATAADALRRPRPGDRAAARGRQTIRPSLEPSCSTSTGS